MVTQVITCPHCASDDVVKNGFAPNNAKQKYLCHACGRQSRQDPSPHGYTTERKGDPSRLPGAIEPARAQAHLRRLAHHGH
ncbi:MAG: IS1 family transposase [Rubrobacter sp.]|nr:IS1 family transposase [Rubrobacter sp.]